MSAMTSATELPTTAGASSESAPPAATRPGIVRVLVAPWWYVFRPDRAADTWASCHIVAWLAALFAHTALLTVIVATAYAFAWRVTSHWVQNARGTWRQEVTLQSAWAAFQTRWVAGQFDDFDAIFLFVPLGALGATLLLAWFHWPTVGTESGAIRALIRSIRGVSSVAAFVILWVSLIGGLAAFAEEIKRVLRELRFDSAVLKLVEFTIIMLGFVGAWSIIAWTIRCVAAVRTQPRPIPARCERCGYHLFAAEPDARCPECGTPVSMSIVPENGRKPSAWESLRPWQGGLIETTWEQLFQPTQFFRRTAMLGETTRYLAFPRWHLLSIGLGAAIWLLCMMASKAPDALEVAVIPILAALAATLAGFAVHHGAAALAFTLWHWFRGPLDPRAVRRVIVYETTYLWLYCLFNGTLFTVLFWFDGPFLGGAARNFSLRLFGVPPEVALFFAGNGALIVIALVRFIRAFAAVRWANR